jgi:serine/threonine-protein kinase
VHHPHLRQAKARIGEKALGYTLERLIDVGGMAAVYEGKRWRTRVAVKVLHRDYCLMEEAVERFARESYASNQVGHADVVRVLEDGRMEDGTPFFVMELLEGRSLEERLAASPTLPLAEALTIIERVLDVLVAAHARGVIHRDIKPGNLFLTASGGIKVLDFGLARVLDGGSHARTRTGTVIGTASYMSPEQARRDPKLIDARTDLWSVGAVLFRCLTGRTVHGEERQGPALIAAATRPAPAFATVLPAAPTALAALVDRALAFKKEDRFADAVEMLAVARTIESTWAGPLPDPPPPSPDGDSGFGDSILVDFDDEDL